MRRRSTLRRPVTVVGAGGIERRSRRDQLATEEPLELRLVREEELRDGVPLAEAARPLTVTMRTPGADFELAAGFLFAEGVVSGVEQIRAIRYCVGEDGAQRYNVVSVVLAAGTEFDAARLQRSFHATSSCGVCGKASIEAACGAAPAPVGGSAELNPELLLSLPGRLREAQPLFERTGGLHAAALFRADGELVSVREDVGRHNALDKLVGAALLAGELPLTDQVALMSGRLSFELAQKAARAGVTTLAGVSAPSSLAVELAEEVGMTLVGFLRGDRFNVYAGAERIAAAVTA